MSIASQNKQILDYLRLSPTNTLTPLLALKLFGCFRLGARVYDINKSLSRSLSKGRIKSRMVSVLDFQTGKIKRVAQYHYDAEETNAALLERRELPTSMRANKTLWSFTPNAQISGGTLSAESDCSVLRKRIADLEEGLRKIAVWTQEDQDDHDICVLQWRGCVAIARELLKPNIQIANKQ